MALDLFMASFMSKLCVVCCCYLDFFLLDVNQEREEVGVQVRRTLAILGN